MRKVNLIGAAILALTTGAWSYGAIAQTSDQNPPADTSSSPPSDSSAAPADTGSSDTSAKKPMMKHMHHHMAKGHGMHGMKSGDTKSGDTAVDDLNAQSLDAAKEGKSFSPPTSTPAAAEGSEKGMSGMKHNGKMMHHHHKMMKKAAAPASGDTGSSSGSSDSGTSGSGDTSSTPPSDSSGK